MIVRITKRENPYAQIDRRLLEDPALSWKAKGLLCYLLSKPPEWVVRLGDLVNSATDGEEAVRSALRELKKAGYASLETVRSPCSGQVSGKQWIIREEPEGGYPAAPKVLPAADMAEKPTSENTDMGEIPTSGKSHPSKKEEGSKKELIDSAKAGADGQLDLIKPAWKVSPLPPALSTPEHLQAWEAFLEVRKKKRAPMTDVAKARIVKDLLEMGPEIALASIWQSVRKAWVDVYPLKGQKNPGPQKPTTTTTTTTNGQKVKLTAADAL